VEGGVPSDGSNAGGSGLAGEERRVQSAGDHGPEGAAPRGVVAQNSADEQGCLADGGGDSDGAVIIRVSLRANDRGKKGDEGGHVGQARGVMLDASAQGGELRERGLPAVEKILKKSRQFGFLVGGNGQCTEESVHDHAGVCYTLGGVLTFVVAQAEAELKRQAVPPVLRAPGLTSASGADGAAANESQAGGMRWCLGGEDRIVHPDGAVERRGVEAARRRGGEN
jgi:hypothetical protein